MLGERPNNIFEKKGMMDKEIQEEVRRRHNSLVYEDPFEALKVLSKAQCKYLNNLFH